MYCRSNGVKFGMIMGIRCTSIPALTTACRDAVDVEKGRIIMVARRSLGFETAPAQSPSG